MTALFHLGVPSMCCCLSADCLCFLCPLCCFCAVYNVLYVLRLHHPSRMPHACLRSCCINGWMSMCVTTTADPPCTWRHPKARTCPTLFFEGSACRAASIRSAAESFSFGPRRLKPFSSKLFRRRCGEGHVCSSGRCAESDQSRDASMAFGAAAGRDLPFRRAADRSVGAARGRRLGAQGGGWSATCRP